MGSAGRGFFLEKKQLLRKQKKNKKKTYCRANFWKKGLLSSFLKLIRTKQRSKKGLFSSIFLLNIAFKPHKRQGSQFPRQNYKSKRWKPSEGENQYCINIFSYSFLCFFYYFYLILFDSIWFFYFDWLFTNHFYYFLYILMGGLMWIMVEMNKDPWYAMG